MKKIKVEKCEYIFLKRGKSKIKCRLQDGAIWERDTEINNWKCTKPSDVELEKELNEFLKLT